MLPASIENTQICSAVPCSYGGELARAKVQDQQYFSDTLQTFLIELNSLVKDNGGVLDQE
jgi:hypothetical protein